MVQATVDNTPVSIGISSGQSTTVPTGETWKVTITGGKDAVAINNNDLIPRDDHGTHDTVLVGGDTVSQENYYGGNGAHIGGFKL